MAQQKILFIDRDGTLIQEPPSQQIDCLEALNLMPGSIEALSQLRKAGYQLVMVSNQDGLGTAGFTQADFDKPHQFMLRIFASQGIHFQAIHICPHTPQEKCECRKPKVGLVLSYLRDQCLDRANSWVIGDRLTDVQLAHNMGIGAIHFGQADTVNWPAIVQKILFKPRYALINRQTKETRIAIAVNLDQLEPISIQTGIGFFDHMLTQLAAHGGFSLSVVATGDLYVDEHHTVEDTAITLGKALRKALGDKLGISRYGFLLPMDEALTQVALDLSGRAYFVLDGSLPRDQIGQLSTEMVIHFFHSLAEGLKATLHIKVQGHNTHHMVESMFKSVGRALGQAFTKVGNSLPSTKGVL